MPRTKKIARRRATAPAKTPTTNSDHDPTGQRRAVRPCTKFVAFEQAPGYCQCGWMRHEHARSAPAADVTIEHDIDRHANLAAPVHPWIVRADRKDACHVHVEEAARAGLVHFYATIRTTRGEQSLEWTPPVSINRLEEFAHTLLAVISAAKAAHPELALMR
jgi:hypothetical protein